MDENFQKSKGESKGSKGGQLQLFPTDAGSELLSFDENFRISGVEDGKYPLSTTEKDAKRLHDVIAEIAAGNSFRSIQKRYSVGYHTLKAIEGKYLGEIAARKERLARKWEFFSELAVDRMIEQVDGLDINRLFLSAGTAVDKALTLRGEASMISRQLGASEPKPNEYLDYVDSLKRVGAMGLEAADGLAQKGSSILEGGNLAAAPVGTDEQSVKAIHNSLCTNEENNSGEDSG